MRKNKDVIVENLKKSSWELDNVLRDEFVGMIFFGSWAREEAKADSDIDVLVVLRSIGGFEARSKVYNIIAEQMKMPLTLIDARLGEITSEDYELTPLMLNVVYDGIVVWDRDGVLEDFVKKGRELIEREKLVRYRVPDGKYGWKRADGKPIALSNVALDDQLKLNPIGEVRYRIRLAQRYLKDAEEAFRRSDWRMVVASSQLCAEDAAKAVIAFFKVSSWSHDPSPELIDILSDIPSNVRKLVEELASMVRSLAPEHGRSSYGEPVRGLTPWDIYSAGDAERALGMARKSFENALITLRELGVEIQ